MLNRTPARFQTQSDGLPPRPWARWLTILSDRPPAQVRGLNCQRLTGEGPLRQLIFDGALYNRADLERELGSSPNLSTANIAEVILAGYLRWGSELLPRLRGPLALVIWDSDREALLAVRDPLGSHPLFFAEKAGQVFVSPAIDLLTQQSGVSRELNRMAMADFIMQRTLGSQDTFFEFVRRIPAGHAISFERNNIRKHRYWDPAPEGIVNWTGPAEVERFDEFLDRAVSRCLSFGPAGIFLSGGLDSVSVAASAMERCRVEGLPQPLALSLVFPHPDTNEETVQRSVAEQPSRFSKPPGKTDCWAQRWL